MQIRDHLLYNDDGTQVRFVEIPNYNKATRILAHEYLVLHFTGGMNLASVVHWFKNPAARVSAHLLVGRDGSVVQFVPFDTVAWHAGESAWADRTSLNKYSIGIELDNAGNLRRNGSQWMLGNNVVPEEQVVVKTHTLEFSPRGWHIYTPAQLETCRHLAQLLCTHYRLVDVVGHEDISLGGKMDPGPAFPMQEIRLAAFGLKVGDPVHYTTLSAIYLREGPSDRHPVTGQALKNGARVQVLERKRGWANVAVAETAIKGWLPERRLKRVPTAVVVQPAPVEPAPVEPAPVEPAPVEPAPVEPAPVEPAPVEPAPVEPAPVEPAPVEPAQPQPQPQNPPQVPLPSGGPVRPFQAKKI